MVRPWRAPTSNSLSRWSSLAASPVACSTYAQVCRARARSEVHSAAGSRRREARRDGRRLGVPDLVELDVGVPLGPAGLVPGGAAVPEQDQAASRRHCPRPEVTVSGSEISGQSRQSRSRA